MNLAAARSFRFVPPTLRASSALLLISTPPDSQFPLVFNPSLYRKPRYISYQQYASSTPWCRPCAYSRSQRSYQAYCRSSAPSGCPPAAAPASLDVCEPEPAAASRSGTAPGPAGFGLWSLRTDGIDCSVSLDTRGYIFSSFAVICWWQQPFALTGGMELDALASYGMTDSFFFHSGVAVGSSVGHAIGGFFGGGGSAPAEQQQQAPADAQPMDSGMWQSSANSSWENNAPCETDISNFRRCMDEQQGNMSICGWYLDQLVCLLSRRPGKFQVLTTYLQKACQAAAKPY